MERLIKEAYAKVNLGLDVLCQRPDGYHEVKMIMQTVDIRDTLTFTKKSEQGITLKTDKAELPVDGDNLICRAAKLLFDEAGITQGVDIILQKRIPIAAGMAGGSADAAATLLGLNEMFEIGYSIERLQRIGIMLGADIPYCIVGGTALAEGIGAALTKLPAPPQCILVAAKPDIDVSTGFVYKNLKLDATLRHPDIDGMVEAIKEGSLSGITDRMGNVLETVTVKEYPIIDTIKNVMKRAGAENALMSGSGPTVFGIFTTDEQARKAAEQIKNQKLAGQVFVTGFV